MYKSSKINHNLFPEQVRLVAEVAEEEGYKVEWLDRWSGFLYRINGRLFGYAPLAKFPLNQAMARSVCRDKAFTYVLLEEAGIGVPEGDYFLKCDQEYGEYCRGKGKDEALAWARHLGYPVFVKPNSLSMGKLCRRVYDENELIDHIEQVFGSDYIVLVQRIVTGKEYRVVVVDDEIGLCYHKSPPVVRGDGRTQLAVLMEKTKSLHKGRLEVDWKQLEKRGYSSQSVLKENEELILKDVANLNRGGWVVEVLKKYPPKLQSFIKKISQVLSVRYFGLDLICHDLSELETYIVLEVNADPGYDAFMEHDRQLTKEVFRRILVACFK
ncbi:MAG: hypothetical protein WC570_01630 [Patescibacteria group bacterium]